ncbi:hypothetical protein Pstr01_26120 [Pseudomonas straminea]|uniref:Uncharacterized membrane protein YsdA, DUF1294 family n=1 Tax=Pseudomonas straminea TaxID=47882 RepID=A0A1I1VWH1_PSEOC|nr:MULTISPECIES: cold shock and DUF1294 domain-containing protein [Pseudomonas]TWE00783.1 uncharacterized membrane protein YsdA (DUF1294 family) [Pseudomonas sp. AG1028]GLX14373.1 hypothetical protein Pstr01_26120 [Pseudomonas straminea]SFD87089.1 Uncharacterized membrane protein YsdA, DUF1294 family [Pseudomonas straminea]
MQSREQAGRIKRWDDDKGFGFIQPLAGGTDVFAHISAMRGDRRPTAGDQVLFVAGRDDKGRLRAEHVRLAGELAIDQPQIRVKPTTAKPNAGRPNTKAARPTTRGDRRPAAAVRNPLAKWLVFAALCLLPVFGALRWLASGMVWPALLYPVVSVLCFFLYWHDKNSAQQGRQRTPENTLHLVELAGGWPGALVAQQAFRHKTRKASYQLVFWSIVALHQLVWIDQLLLGGAYTSGWLRSLL